MNHKQRREARYRAMGMVDKAGIAAMSPNNRSRRARGRMRAVLWAPSVVCGHAFAQAVVFTLHYPNERKK